MDIFEVITFVENRILSLQYSRKSAESLGDLATAGLIDLEIYKANILLTKLKKAAEES